MSRKQTCAPTAHAFDKFDDATIFCRNCGEQRVVDVKALVASLPAVTYLPCPGPHYPTTWPTWTQPRIWYGTTTATAEIGNTVTYDPTIATTLTVKS